MTFVQAHRAIPERRAVPASKSDTYTPKVVSTQRGGSPILSLATSITTGRTTLGHLITVLFAMICSFGHSSTDVARHNDPFVPPAEFVSASYEVPVSNHDSLARRSALNSYSEDVCLSCRMTNATSQPQLILRAQR
jgi:hypothetical protein